jgi:ribosomal protein S18 acetylase RimI-like enzyme
MSHTGFQSSSPLAEFLAWDSEFFGVRIARVAGDTMSGERAAALEDYCRRERIDCLYFLARLDDPITTGAAWEAGFALVDVRMTLERSVSVGDGADGLCAEVRMAREDDLSYLCRIARASHTDSRFYFDGHFARDPREALYEHWITASVRGYADAVFVAAMGGGGGPIGYVTCHLDPDVGRIGLLAVDAAAVGKGWGSRLVDRALAFFVSRGRSDVTVVTQGRNIGAQRLYQGRGFRTRDVGLYYHKWASPGE